MRNIRSRLALVLRLFVGCSPLLFQSACSLPSLNVVPGLPMAPNIQQLQAHVTCVMAQTMDAHLNPTAPHDPKDFERWLNLARYNVLDTVNFTLFVTQSQGLNPGINFITPLTSLGKPIENVVESSNGLTDPKLVTGNANNFTLSVGFQLSGTQDHNFVLNYVIDLHRLYNSMYRMNDAEKLELDPTSAVYECIKPGHKDPASAISYGLKGDLALAETLDSGLNALDKSPFAPVTAGSGKANQGGATVAQSSGATAFSSKINFTLLWGVNGGPSWNLLKRKAGGSGNNQLLSYTRSKQDSMISTFAPTCKSDHPLDVTDGRLFYKPVFTNETVTKDPGFDSFEIAIYKRRVPKTFADESPKRNDNRADELPARDLTREGEADLNRDVIQIYHISIAVPRDKTGLTYAYVGSGTGIITVYTLPEKPRADGKRPTAETGTISFPAYVTSKSADPAKPTEPFAFALHGTIMDTQAGTSLGYANIGINLKDADPIGTLELSDNAISVISREGTAFPSDFWASLPSCSNSGPYQSNGLNVLQQLPGDQRSTFLQQ